MTGTMGTARARGWIGATRRWALVLGMATVLAVAAAGGARAQEAGESTDGSVDGNPGAGAGAGAADKYVGYYYPPPRTSEPYGPRVETLPRASARMRVAFVSGITKQVMDRPYPPPFALLTKGTDRDHLIVVGLTDEGFGSLYRMRAWLGMLTAIARTTPAFADLPSPPESLTFLDLLKRLGFEDLVVTDGRTLAHRIRLL